MSRESSSEYFPSLTDLYQEISTRIWYLTSGKKWKRDADTMAEIVGSIDSLHSTLAEEELIPGKGEECIWMSPTALIPTKELRLHELDIDFRGSNKSQFFAGDYMAHHWKNHMDAGVRSQINLMLQSGFNYDKMDARKIDLKPNVLLDERGALWHASQYGLRPERSKKQLEKLLAHYHAQLKESDGVLVIDSDGETPLLLNDLDDPKKQTASTETMIYELELHLGKQICEKYFRKVETEKLIGDYIRVKDPNRPFAGERFQFYFVGYSVYKPV